MTNSDFIWLMNQMCLLQNTFKTTANNIRLKNKMTVHYDLDFVNYGNEVMLEMFMEVNLTGSSWVCWWFDIKYIDAGFEIDASLRQSDQNGQQDDVWNKIERVASVKDLMETLHRMIGGIAEDFEGRGY